MDITTSPSGRVIRTLKGYKAFVPNDLPPFIEWNNVLIATLSRADHVLGMLAREGSQLPNPHLFVRPFITREAVLSSKIEGTQATLEDLLTDDAGAQTGRNPDEIIEVRNYIVALDFGLQRIQEFPLSLRLIREMHEKLMQGVRGAHATPGHFRTSQNWIGSPGSTIQTAKFVPPPPEEMMDSLTALELFLHDRTLPPLIHIALCHYQFEAIHPFLDGNGRIGRLLITLLLVEMKLLPTPLLYLSAFFESTRDEYYRQLLNVSKEGSWNDWLIYFLQGVTSQGQDVLSRAEKINNLLTAWQALVASSGAVTSQKIVNHLAINPYVTTKKSAEQLEVSYTTAQRAINRLLDLGILTQTSQGRRNRVYCALEILAILEKQTPVSSTHE
jgi:Fic family protein